jgi:hypothetical protein
MAQDPLSRVASWLSASDDIQPAGETVETADPIVGWKAEIDRLQVEIEPLDDPPQELIAKDCQLFSKIWKTVAISPAGLIAQLEELRDMHLQPSSRQRELIARARRMARERLAPRADRHDRDASFPFDEVGAWGVAYRRQMLSAR